MTGSGHASLSVCRSVGHDPNALSRSVPTPSRTLEELGLTNGSGRVLTFFDFLAAMKPAARPRYFVLTHGHHSCLMILEGVGASSLREPGVHVFDSLGPSLNAGNQRAYVLSLIRESVCRSAVASPGRWAVGPLSSSTLHLPAASPCIDGSAARCVCVGDL
jgi:hypothetical protein